MTTSDPPIITGSCLCRKITYKLTDNPIDTKLCHCDNCRKASGSAFAANSFYYTTQFQLTSSTTHLRTYADTAIDTGGTCERSFCGECGSPLFTLNKKYPANIIVTSGTMDRGEGVEVGGWRPEQELYCKRKAGWVGVEGTEQRGEL